ncbi:hypothetical protein ABZV34_23805 [Streptomyces sp. NPDC005195]|uniref:hypothetical protein n=1 Tax=Streptomyces sp. NPDC005195 TaxID=3154561 RepID=UPI0033B38E72
MPLPVFQVDVPIHRTDQPAASGVHVFTGRADSRSAAVRNAHEVYDAARTAQDAGREIPHESADGWCACGYRPGWQLDWSAARASRWVNPNRWTKARTFEL